MNLKFISDISKAEQTDELKQDVYKWVRQFVYKYWRHYHPHFKGNLDDLVSEYFIQILTPKSRIKGQEENLLDKYDPSVTSLIYLVKQVVIRKLIDSERSSKDKDTINYSNTYDEDGDLSINYLSSKVDNAPSVEGLDLSNSEIQFFKDKFAQMTAREKGSFMKDFKAALSSLSESSKSMFKQILGSWYTEEEGKVAEPVIKNVPTEKKSILSEDLSNEFKAHFNNLVVSETPSTVHGVVLKVVSPDNSIDFPDVNNFFVNKGFSFLSKKGTNYYFKQS